MNLDTILQFVFGIPLNIFIISFIVSTLVKIFRVRNVESFSLTFIVVNFLFYTLSSIYNIALYLNEKQIYRDNSGGDIPWKIFSTFLLINTVLTIIHIPMYIFIFIWKMQEKSKGLVPKKIKKLSPLFWILSSIASALIIGISIFCFIKWPSDGWKWLLYFALFINIVAIFQFLPETSEVLITRNTISISFLGFLSVMLASLFDALNCFIMLVGAHAYSCLSEILGDLFCMGVLIIILIIKVVNVKTKKEKW